MEKKKETQAYTTIQRIDGEKKVTDVLDLTQAEFEKLVEQYSIGIHSEKKYVPFTLKNAQRLAKVGEKLEGAGSIRTEGFESAVVFFMELAKRIWQITQKNKSFRMELFYNAETLKTNYYFFVPTDKYVSDDIRSEPSNNQDQNFH